MRQGELARMDLRGCTTLVSLVAVAHLGSTVAVYDSRRRDVAKLLGVWQAVVEGIREGGSGARRCGNGLSDRIIEYRVPIVQTSAEGPTSVWRFACHAMAKQS